MRCDHCADLLWDHLYGLLDADQEQALRAHLATCPACRAALAEAETRQRMVARAARIYDTVAPFVPPASEDDQVTRGQGDPVATEVAPPVTLSPGHPVTLSLQRRRWPGLAAAAALLLLVGGYAWYQNRLSGQETARDRALLAVEKIDTRLQEEGRSSRRAQAALPRSLRSRRLELKVLGAAAFQPEVRQRFRVETRDLNGAPAAARVTARLLAGGRARRQVLATAQFRSRGTGSFSFPSGVKVPPGAGAVLELEARYRGQRETVRERLGLLPPSYLTHLVLDKEIYRYRETLFFRTVTLDRFTSRLPDREFVLVATVTDSRGTQRLRRQGRTGAGGIGGGELVLTDDLAEGECTLDVSEASGRFPPVRRRFFLVRTRPSQLDKALTFDQAVYGPGEAVHANFRARRQNGRAVANRPVQVTVDLNGKRMVQPRSPSRTNARGEADFQFRLPDRVGPGKARVKVVVKDDTATEELVKTLPVLVPRLGVEFFPEGGNLVAGLPNRVYFRVRTRLGKPADMTGVVVDGRGRDVLKVQSIRRQGLGVFRLTPRTGEVYRLRTTSLGGVTTTVQLPRVRPAGVVLRVPGVSSAGAPLRARIRATPGERAFLVAASFRGRPVDQRAVKAGPGGIWVELEPAPEVHGVLRVTVYEPQGGRLVPRAERLVYRLPARRLRLAVQSDRPVYHPGEKVTLRLRAADERGRPASPWLLAAVVDEQALRTAAHPAEPDLPTHFFLTSDLSRPEDLEQADIWVRDNPRSLAALDRFLGTQGWRRFVENDRAALRPPVLVKADRKELRKDSGALAFFNLDNGPRVRENYRQALRAERAKLLARAEERVDELQQDRKHRLAATQRAEEALADLRDLPQDALRWGLAGLVGLLLGAGCVFLVIGLVRAVLGSSGNTRYFATAFASLLLCTLLVYATRQSEGRNLVRVASDPKDLARAPEVALDEFPPEWETRLPPVLPPGRFAAPPRAKDSSAREQRDGDEEGTAGDKATGNGANLRGGPQQKMKKVAQEKEPLRLNRKRFVRESKKPQKAMGGRGYAGGKGKKKKERRPAPGGLDRGADKGPKPPGRAKQEGKNGFRGAPGLAPVQYAFLYPQSSRAGFPYAPDTVLWVPALRLESGSARVSFDLPGQVTTYRILVYGHDPQGRLGVLHGKLLSQDPTAPTVRKPAKSK
jgi:hypothetical protein